LLIRIACWIHKATNTKSQYLIIIAFPLQQCLHERVSVLLCTYNTCLVCLHCRAFLIVIYISVCVCVYVYSGYKCTIFVVNNIFHCNKGNSKWMCLILNGYRSRTLWIYKNWNVLNVIKEDKLILYTNESVHCD